MKEFIYFCILLIIVYKLYQLIRKSYSVSARRKLKCITNEYILNNVFQSN